ncbi:hypothetical protein D3C81_2130380 [compost metagenome]
MVRAHHFHPKPSLGKFLQPLRAACTLVAEGKVKPDHNGSQFAGYQNILDELLRGQLCEAFIKPHQINPL